MKKYFPLCVRAYNRCGIANMRLPATCVVVKLVAHPKQVAEKVFRAWKIQFDHAKSSVRRAQ